jgi:hypothetical protein
MSAQAATSSTDYEVVGVDSPDRQPFARFPERLIDVADLTGDGVRDVYASSYLIDIDGVVNAGKVVLVDGATQEIVREIISPELRPEAPNPVPPARSGQNGPQFGFYISVPGDVNGDGLEDLVVGAPYQDVGNNLNQGKAYVFSGADGRRLDTIENPNPQPDEGVFATFGGRVGAAGDVTGDGVPDILVGSPAQDVPEFCGFDPADTPSGCRKNEGEAFVFDGATRDLVRTYRVPAADRQEPECSTTFPTDNPATPDVVEPDRPELARCGNLSVAQSPGDLDRDGVADHLVSAYSLKRPSVATPTFFGRVYLFSGRTGDVLARIDQPAPSTTPPGAFFGLQDLAPNTPGDVTGDGVPDLYVSAFFQSGAGGQSGAGRAWVFDGAATLAAGQGVVEYELIDPDLGPSRGFGCAASCTDYNKDGTPDLYVSNAASSNTETYVFEGRTGSLLKTLGLPPGVGQAPSEGNAGTALGQSSRAPGDLNGDGEPDYVATAQTQDVGGTQDQGRLFFFLSNAPAAGAGAPSPCGLPAAAAAPPQQPTPPGPPSGPGPCGQPGGAGYLNPAKLRVSRARVLREDRRLDVLAPITTRARGGEVDVEFHADDRRDTFKEEVTDANTALDEIRILEPITRGQARLGTGIVNLTYLGDADTRPEFVRLRAASQRAELDVEKISLIGDRLAAQGSVTARAEGIVRLRYSYVEPDGSPSVHLARAEIQEDGDWELEGDQVPAQLARCGGYLSIQFTGYFERRIRGEQLAYELNAGQTRNP